MGVSPEEKTFTIGAKRHRYSITFDRRNQARFENRLIALMACIRGSTSRK
jgi:hypothetical protein